MFGTFSKHQTSSKTVAVTVTMEPLDSHVFSDIAPPFPTAEVADVLGYSLPS